MGSHTFLLNLALTALALNIAYGTVNQVPLPTIDLEEWWGPGNATTETNVTISNYTVKFNASMISDLIRRLENHRPLVSPLEDIEFEYGFNKDVLELWRKYLINEYPFAERETFLNQYSHFTTIIQGLRIHFMRAKSQNTTGKVLVPLLILHGWPGSVREFYETIPYLLSFSEAKGFALDIIMPSLPGYVFSQGAARPGLGVDKVAVICRNLMHRLGYFKFAIQGGDMGAIITNAIATKFSKEVIGYHTNFPLVHNPEIIFQLLWRNYFPEGVVEPQYESRLYPSWTKFTAIVARTGYLHIQATKPDTFGVGLSDSPLGLMAHILVTTGTPNNTGTVSAVQLLDNYMLYWSTNCVTTAMRLYAETFNKRYVGLRINEIKTDVPTWVLQAPNETIYLPEWLLRKKFTNLLNVTMPTEGGHFYAWQMPEHYAENVVDAIVAFMEWHVKNDTLYNTCSSYITN